MLRCVAESIAPEFRGITLPSSLALCVIGLMYKILAPPPKSSSGSVITAHKACGVSMVRFVFLFKNRRNHFQPAHLRCFQNRFAYLNTAYCNVARLPSAGVTGNPILDAFNKSEAFFPPCFAHFLCPAFARLVATGSMSKECRFRNAILVSDRAGTSFLYFSIAFLKSPFVQFSYFFGG
jgi:hypothetical protein